MSAIAKTGDALAEASGELCVVILAPFGQDAVLIGQMLASAAIEGLAAPTLEAFAQKLPDCAAGVLTTEALSPEAIAHLHTVLQAQPPWSDIPLILLSTQIDAASYALLARTLGNITILPRPLEAASLLTVVRAALRARQKQYQVRALLQAAQTRQQEIEALNARLARGMQETHHRIKNNLQVIAALIEMQGYGVSPIGETALRRINTHVCALATIHDLLTQKAKGDADLSDLNAEAMLKRLIPILEGMAQSRPIRCRAEALSLPVQQSAALALLVNELVSNAIKHGTGEIEVTLQRFEADTADQEREVTRARLEVCDDGPGFPEGFDPRQAAHTGLELIDSAARWDLKGEVIYENRKEGGARVVVTFPVQSGVTIAAT